MACLFWLDATGFEVENEPATKQAEPAAEVTRPAPVIGEPILPWTAPEAEARAIDVTVLSASGEEVADATVEVVGLGLWPARKATTDANGRVRLTGLESGIFDLRAYRDDEVVGAPVTVVLPKTGTEQVTLRLVKGRTVRVRVLDADKKPLPSAQVVLAEGGLSPFPLEAVTNDEGVAVIRPVAPTKVTLGASAEGYVPRSGIGLDPTDAGEVDIVLLRGGMLVGEVVDGRGRAIEGARIEVIGTDTSGAPIAETSDTRAFRAEHFTFALQGPRPLLPAGELGVMPGPLPDIPRDPGLSWPTSVTPSDSGSEPWVTRGDGTFRASFVPPGRLRVIARHPDFVEAISTTLRLAPGETERVKLVMRQGGNLKGRVLDERDEPIASARIDVVALRGGTFTQTLTTDERGAFTASALPERVAVTVTRPGMPDASPHREELRLGEGETKEIEIRLPALREPVRVRVTDEDDAPLSFAQVSITSLSPKTPLRRTRFTSETGEIEFPDTVGLPLELEVTLPGRAPVVMQVESAPREINVELSRGLVLLGSVTTRRGYDSLPDAEVVLSSKAMTRRTRTDERGAFRLEDVGEGTATLTISREGYVSVERKVTIQKPRRSEPIELDAVNLEEGGVVEGEVVDDRGRPVAGARVAKDLLPAYSPSGRAPKGVATTDDAGRFQVADLPEGEVLLVADSPDAGKGRVEVTVRAGRVTDRVRLVLSGKADETEEAIGRGGVAVTLGERDVEGNVHVIVVLVAEASEAERAGLRRGDRIVSIGSETPNTMKEARALLSGPVGESVIVEVERGDGRHTLSIPREEVKR